MDEKSVHLGDNNDYGRGLKETCQFYTADMKLLPKPKFELCPFQYQP